jgi:hypothetical protein
LSRLLTFGCSYTHYVWPTWSDFLSLNFQDYENWAIPGLGNQAIFERLIECHAKNPITKDDTVVVQWSGHMRFDFFNRHVLKDRTSNWRTSGSIFSQTNKDILDKKWQYLFFDEFGYIMHTLNYVHAIQNMLASIGCTWYMTSIGDLRKLGFDLVDNQDYAEKVKGIAKDTTAFTRYPDLSFYQDAVWERFQDHWLDPIQPYSVTNHKDKFYSFIATTGLGKDLHPSPFQQKEWLNNIAAPKLNITINKEEQDNIVNSIEDLYKALGANKIRTKFDDQLEVGNFNKPKKMNWPNTYKGLY